MMKMEKAQTPHPRQIPHQSSHDGAGYIDGLRRYPGGSSGVSIASPLMLPSPFDRRVGIRIVTFEACSGFTHVTARRIAQPPKAAFVTRLQPCRLPNRSSATRSIDNSLSGIFLH
jgi:hypothetical protein